MIDLTRWLFAQGADVISRIKDVIVDFLVDKQDNIDELTALFTNAAEIRKQGFLILEFGSCAGASEAFNQSM